jgi:hypothetical protein
MNMKKIFTFSKPMIVVFFSIFWGFFNFASAAEVKNSSYQNGILTLTVAYEGDGQHDFSVELDPECDSDDAIAGRLLDSGWEDTELNGMKTKTISVKLDFPCDAKILYLFTDGRRRVQITLK